MVLHQDILKVNFLKNLVEKYPIYSIEDGLSEDDWSGWQNLTKSIGKNIQLVGDDLYVTQKKFLKRGIDENAGNSILIKLNQVGTVSETIENIKKLNIEFSKEADEKGQLYGAISKKEILNFLKDNEVKIHSDDIVLSEQIRSIGEHEIIVNPYTDIQETIKITVHKN